MAKTVTIGKSRVRHLVVSAGTRHKSPLCGAVESNIPDASESPRKIVSGKDVTCENCKLVLVRAVENALA